MKKSKFSCHAFSLGLVAFAALAPGACGSKVTSTDPDDSDGTDSNTHWLSQCDKDADCGGELACLCGVCSVACSGDSVCSGFEGGQCLAEQCSNDDEAVGLCSQSCDGDDDCPGATRCQADVCVPSSSDASDDAPASDEPSNDAGPSDDEPTNGDASNDDGGLADDAASDDSADDTSDDSETDVVPPTTDEPPTDDSATDEPTTDEPTADDTTTDATNADEPATDDSAADDTNADDATTDDVGGDPGEGCAAMDVTFTADGCSETSNGYVFDGQDCVFISYCDCTGPDCDSVGPQAVCQAEYRYCTPVEELCPAMDVRVFEPECDDSEPIGFAWNGSSCEPLLCNCEGTQCNELRSSAAECLADFAGCTDDVPWCTAQDFPFAPVDVLYEPVIPEYSFSFRDAVDRDVDGNLLYTEWTQAEWLGITPLPLEPLTCPEVEGLDTTTCPYPAMLQLQTADGMLTLDLITHWDLVRSVNAPAAVEFRVESDAFYVRGADDNLPVLFITRQDLYTRAVGQAANWELPPFHLEAATPVCKSLPIDCNFLSVPQTLNVSTPSGNVELTPFTRRELEFEPEPDTWFFFDLVHAYTIDRAVDLPGEACGVQVSRTDSIVLLRVELDED